MLGILGDLDILLIAKYMGIELLIGAMVGVIFKQIMKMRANGISDSQVISARDYTSTYFGNDFPKHAFEVFRLPPDFVIVQSKNDAVISEEYFSVFGSATKATYKNGKYQGHGYSAFSSPVYLCTVVLPILVGFFPSLLPFVGKIFEPCLFSGLAWSVMTFVLPALFLIFNQTSGSQE